MSPGGMCRGAASGAVRPRPFQCGAVRLHDGHRHADAAAALLHRRAGRGRSRRRAGPDVDLAGRRPRRARGARRVPRPRASRRGHAQKSRYGQDIVKI
eukprot:462021-Prorocentrum_minimum.AAC.1